MTASQGIPAEENSTGRAKVALAAGLSAILLVLAAITWGPHLARDYLASQMAAWIGRDVRIGGIEIQPFRRRILVRDFAVAAKAAPAEPLLVVPEASAQVDLSAALRGRVQLGDVLLRSPTLSFARVSSEIFSFQDILDRLGGNADEAGKPLSFVLEEAEIEEGKLVVRDEVAETLLQVLRLQMRLANLSNQPSRPDRPFGGKASFEFQDAPVVVTFQGSPLAEPRTLEAHVRLSGLALETLAPYVPPEGAVRVAGRLAGTADLSYGTGGWGLANGNLDLAEATLQVDTQQPATIESMRVQGLRLDFDRRRAAARALRLDGAQLAVRRDPQGRLQVRALVSDAIPERQRGAAGVTEAGSAGAAQTGWRYSLDAVDLDEVQLSYIDMTLHPERRLPSLFIGLHAENVSSDLSQRVPFRASLAFGEEARLSLQGNLQPRPFKLVGRAEVSDFDITPFEPYFGLLPNLSLVSGKVWGKGDFEVAADARNDLTGISYHGELSVNDVRARDNVLKTDFVRWRALVASVVLVEWRPAAIGDTRIEIGDVAFVDFFGKAVLDEKGRLNLKHLLERSAGEPGSGHAAAASNAERTQRQDGRVSVRIGPLRIASGHINFTDNFVDPNYTADLMELSGSIAGVASEQREPAEIAISGQVNGEAPLEIQGEINLLAPQPMLDLRATASGIELTQLSPYAVRWAGYAIERGTLSAKMHYRLEDGQLEADNRLVLHQLRLGEKVESPEAADLPLKLALSLLRDRQGNVTLNLPISGSLADPQFSFAGLVGRALTSLLGKIATAPFSLLASIAGNGAAGGGLADEAAGEGLDHVRFTEGSATIGPDQHRKLEALAAALEDRPALGLQVIGYADRPADRAALRRARLEAALRFRLNRQDSSVEAEPPDVGGDTAGQARRERLLALYRDWVGTAVSARGLGTEDLEKLLLERIDVSEADLLILARRRGMAAVEVLVETGLNGERIELLAPQFAEGNAELPGSRAHMAIVERENA